LGRNDGTYATLFQNHPQPILLADTTTLGIIAANRAATERYGYGAKEFATLSLLDLHRPEDQQEARSAWTQMVEATHTPRLIGTQVAKDGTVFTAEVLSTTLEPDQGSVRMMLVTDVTERDDARADTRESGARYRQIVETAKEGIFTLDTEMVISAVNQRAAELLGYSMDELVGHRISEFSRPVGVHPADAQDVRQMEARFTGEREATLRRKDGTMASVLLNESPLLDGEGRYAGQLGMITDLTEQKGFEDELAFQAVHDTLTGLPNRLLLFDRLQLALRRAEQSTPAVAAVFIDVDGFKNVNAAHGHGGGDELLVEVGRRLSRSVRQRDTVARFGGDEFVVVSEGTRPFTERLVERLRSAIAGPYSVGDAKVEITASMGVAVGEHGDHAGALLRGGDLALSHAKAQGRERTEFFTPALGATSRQRLAIVSDLERAVERREFSLRFQPVVSLTGGSIIGAEALIRWEHPERGTLSPMEFISVAEETGLIDPIGQWVIEETCRRFAGWQQLTPDLSMSLNISARQLTTGIFEIVRDAIAASGVDPSHLALEITEGVLMDDVELSVGTLTALRETGVMTSIDDFGTGYCSLSYLNRFPVDVLKIDQTFVAGLPEDAYGIALVQAVLAIAEALNLSAIAEGVENRAQAETLVSLGCEKAQGYHFFRPLTADAFEAELLAAS
jgi:diguanylate cyclase (GGDEF)-like protein/PAS domain S-box-containing protein